MEKETRQVEMIGVGGLSERMLPAKGLHRWPILSYHKGSGADA
jgi:hypothetical protein